MAASFWANKPGTGYSYTAGSVADPDDFCPDPTFQIG
jgi:hypothetical protein